ncbi:MAG TPA: hypothetical protein VMB03_29895 [Bryobacteraceae bacterium]|nr:hypothetical protein [Bryobacteraceae bacterium]
MMRAGTPVGMEVEVARNGKKTYRLTVSEGATPAQTAIFNDCLR